MNQNLRKHRRHRHRKNGMEQSNEIAYGMQYRHTGDHLPVMEEFAVGHDAYGNPYQYEHFDLPQPKMPHVPVAHIPAKYARPPHPLGKDQRDEELGLAALLRPISDDDMLTMGRSKGSKEQRGGTYAHTDHGALPQGKTVYPDQKPGPKRIDGEQFDLKRESYGP